MAPQFISRILNVFPSDPTLTQMQPMRGKENTDTETCFNVVGRFTHLSSAEPWLWLLVSREKTLRSFRIRRGGDEGGVYMVSGGLR